jgi:hypothetical protein
MQQAGVGDTCWAMDGTHTKGNGTYELDSATETMGTDDDNRVYIKNYPGETPVFQYKIYCRNGSQYLTFDGITFDSLSKDIQVGFILGDVTANSTDYAVGITINNCTFQHAYNRTVEAIQVRRAEDIIISNNTIDNFRCRVPGLDAYGIRVHVRLNGGDIYGNTITDCGAQPCILDADADTYQLIQNIRIYNNTIQVSDSYSYRGIDGNTPSNVSNGESLAGSNTYTTNSTTITRSAGTDDLNGTFSVGHHIIISSADGNNNKHGQISSVSASQIVLAGTPGLVTQATPTSYSFDSAELDYVGESGITVKHSDADIHIYGNTIKNFRGCTAQYDQTGAQGPGFSLLENTQGVYIYKNNVYNCTGLVRAGGFDNAPQTINGMIYSNIFEVPDSPTPALDLNSKNPKGIYLDDPASLDVCNNVINYNSNTPDDMLLTSSCDSTVVIKNNIFIGGTSSDTAGTDSPTMSTNCWGTNVTEVAAHQDAGDIDGDPDLTSDHKPKDDALRSAGTPVQKPIRDYGGRPFKQTPSIGAYEYTSGYPASTRTTRS